MTALTMSVKHGHIDAILNGLKTHTLRIAKPGEASGFYHGVPCIYTPKDRVKWYVGCKRAIKASRTGSALFYVRITSIREMMLCEVDDDLARAEGIYGSNSGRWGYVVDGVLRCEYDTPREAFATLWDSINGSGIFDKKPRVWGLGFELWTK
jgi:hypothetical protein